MPTLAVIDVQKFFLEQFERPCTPLIQSVAKTVRVAKFRKFDIALVEYGSEYVNYGKTHKAIRKALDEYPYIQVIKNHDDGGKEIFEACRDAKFDLDEVYVCGINRCACVVETAWGLQSELENRSRSFIGGSKKPAKVICLEGATDCSCGIPCIPEYNTVKWINELEKAA